MQICSVTLDLMLACAGLFPTQVQRKSGRQRLPLPLQPLAGAWAAFAFEQLAGLGPCMKHMDIGAAI